MVQMKVLIGTVYALVFVAAGLVAAAVINSASKPFVYDPPVMANYEVQEVILSNAIPPEVVEGWKHEVARRFPGAVMVVAHGGEVDGQWYAGSEQVGYDVIPIRPWAKIVPEIQAKFPGRFVVVVSCNPTHLPLPKSLTGIAYCLDTAWVIPDNSVEAEPDRNADPAIVGNIFEFVVQ